jgi:hypothetical protein
MESMELNHIATFKYAYEHTNCASDYEEQMLRYRIQHDMFLQHELHSQDLSDDDNAGENNRNTIVYRNLL